MAGVVANKVYNKVLAASSVAVNLTGSASETVMATISIPGGVIGPNGQLRIRTIWTATNNANNKTRRVRFGAAAAGTGGTLMMGIASASVVSMQHLTQFGNRGVANSQVGAATGAGTGGFTESTSACATASIDTGSACEIAITGQLASAGDTLTLESYSVELISA